MWTGMFQADQLARGDDRAIQESITRTVSELGARRFTRLFRPRGMTLSNDRMFLRLLSAASQLLPDGERELHAMGCDL